MTTTATVQDEHCVSLKLLVEENRNHVIAAEASEDFVDILFVCLTLSLERVTRIIKNQDIINNELWLAFPICIEVLETSAIITSMIRFRDISQGKASHSWDYVSHWSMRFIISSLLKCSLVSKSPLFDMFLESQGKPINLITPEPRNLAPSSGQASSNGTSNCQYP
ncbi:hypothetical protein M9H77_03899 [Catharanthus roseus]|uniref:Uncharacterized protein n=1 Tax=Catharanthus roseus TaxID=4058 RepID=A0ACC0CCJ5_CATRO|nr:hypothetical protein M9H77_03899 [Catharanthus roseus]